MRKTLLMAVLCLLSLPACRKSPDLNQLSSQFVVTTNYDQEAQFNQYKTFYVSDTVAYLGGTDDDTILTDTNAQRLVQTVKDNMAAHGYTFTAHSNEPDLGITVSVVKTVNTSLIYWGWWDGFPGYWGPGFWGWGWAYPFYYPFPPVTVHTFTTGTVIINLIDLINATKEHKLTTIWNANGFGAVGSNINVSLQKGIEAVNQAFTQSPYLKAD